jgi:predicted glycoside hydrolase/deacetylase ChbG (UPF0249 family)
MKRLIQSLTLFSLLLITLFPSRVMAQSQEKPIELLIRADDSGMSHASNLALESLAKTGLPFSTSIMFTCPWYQESVEIIKKYPHISAGIHLTLNAEWKNYRWGPVAGISAVPSLVDSAGFFTPSRAALRALNPTLADIETELRAQIERAVNSGIRIDYVDYHMGAAVETPERRAIVEKLANEYGLVISRYFGERDTESMYSDPIDKKQDKLLSVTQALTPDSLNLFVTHILKDTPEVEALVDLNPFGPKNMSKHRAAELSALLSPEFAELLEKKNISLITYKDLIDRIGLENMKSPLDSGY